MAYKQQEMFTPENLETIKGKIARVFYRTDGWCACKMLSVDNTDRRPEQLPVPEQFGANGAIPAVGPDEVLELTGVWVEDPKYGMQFKVVTALQALPTKLGEIQNFLAKYIEGVGPAKAKLLADKFGHELRYVLDNQPQRLTEVKGITEALALKISTSWNKDKNTHALALFLAGHGINVDTWMKKILSTFGSETISVLKNNPYDLTKVEGIGFRTADEMARKLGWPPTSPQRTHAAFAFVCAEALQNGNTFLYEDQLIEQVQRAAGIKDPEDEKAEEELLPEEEVREILPKVLENGDLIQETFTLNRKSGPVELKLYYLPRLHRAETGLADRVTEILGANLPSIDNLDQLIADAERDLALELEPEQRAAVKQVFENAISVITGGPGTGKTTITRAIVHVCNRLRQRIALASPTGRAAKRLAEVTGEEARTIHRLLEFDPRTYSFLRNRGNPLDQHVVLFDEASMMDTELSFRAFDAVASGSRVVMVGDPDQLPAVGPGNVLQDLIQSKKIAVVTLNRIFRQAGNSQIIRNAHAIRDGLMPQFPTKGSPSDCYIMEPPLAHNPNTGKLSENTKWVNNTLVKLVKEQIPERFGFDPIHDIQVLAPMKKGDCGVWQLNEVLQEALNPDGEEFYVRLSKFRIGDRVMQMRNNYELAVFNGDIGFITANDPVAKYMTIDFYGTTVLYPYEDVTDLTLAYASTVHKVQGSEYKCVLFVLLKRHWMMLQRNLVYTGLTRAKKMAMFLSLKDTIEKAVDNDEVKERNSFLGVRVRRLMFERAKAAQDVAV